jgi:hypothetical protein
MEPNFEALRREFPVLQRKTYLNSGSYCALANEVRAAFEAYRAQFSGGVAARCAG